MAPRVSRPPAADGAERRLAVVGLGSNTFRLVVFAYRPGGPFRLVDEVREVVRLTEGTPPGDPISGDAIGRAARGGGGGWREWRTLGGGAGFS